MQRQRIMSGLLVSMLAVATTGLASCKTAGGNAASSDTLAADSAPSAALKKLGAARKAWLDKVVDANLGDQPIVAAPGNEMLFFLLELPQTLDDTGHAGLGVGNDYFDFGPKSSQSKTIATLDWSQLQTPLTWGKGGPWWKEPAEFPKVWSQALVQANDPNSISLRMILANIKKLAPGYTVLLIPMEVKSEHAQAIRQWWADFYARAPEYTVPGMHCTSAIIKSFEDTDPDFAKRDPNKFTLTKVWLPEVTTPLMYAAKMLDDSFFSSYRFLRYEHRAGPNKGRPLKAMVVSIGNELQAVDYQIPGHPDGPNEVDSDDEEPRFADDAGDAGPSSDGGDAAASAAESHAASSRGR